VRVNDLTVEILKQIRDGVTSLGIRLDDTNERLGRVEQKVEQLGQGLSDLGSFMRQIALDQTPHERFHHEHVDLLEKDVTDRSPEI
jgi:hypothetical protein